MALWRKYALSACLFLCCNVMANAQETIVKYLSGTDKDHTVLWDFYCTTGRKSGSWDKIAVPSNWEQQGFGTYNYFKDAINPEEEGRYKYRFSVPADWKKKKVFLVFEGSMTDTEAKINGRSAGPVHQGGFTRFKYDITDLIKEGDNLLEVTVSKRSANASINKAERTADFWQFGGIFRPVYLEAVPKTHIDHLALDARANGSLRLDVYMDAAKRVDSNSDADNNNVDPVPGTKGASPVNGTISIRTELQTLAGKSIGKIEKTLSGGKAPSGNGSIAKGPAGQESVTLEGKFEGVTPWNPESPALYQLIVSILDPKGRVLHMVRQRFGFRTVEFRKQDGFYVNGHKIIMKGVCRHSEWPETGRTMSKGLSILDVNLMKDMNMNAVRMSHYPPDQHFLDVCDSLGLFVLDELTGWQAKYDTVVGKKLVKELVIRDVNHPSIIIWDNGNEGGWNTGLDDQFRLYDPQDRLVIHPWEKFNGTDTKHYPNYNYVANAAMNGTDVFFPTEFLHGNFDGGIGAGLEDYWDLILKHPYGAGGFLWVFADEGIMRMDKDSIIDVAGDFAPDGILGPHREKEGSYYTIKELWSPVMIDQKRILSGFDGKIPVENRYIYTNLDKCTFKWKLVSFPGPADKTIQPTVRAFGSLPPFRLAPGEKGFLNLPLPADWRQSDALYVTATDAHGREIFTWTWAIKSPEEVLNQANKSRKETRSAKNPAPSNLLGKPAGKDSLSPAITKDDQGSSLIITANGIRYEYEKATGFLHKVVNAKGEISLSGGPVQTGVAHTLKELKSYYIRDSLIVEPVYEGDSYFTVKWIFRPGAMIELDYQYTYSKKYSSTEGVDFMGITFNYPEEKITGMKWLGRGPYRVWKNRLKGQQFGVWQKEYNNTITGADWSYPEFKGYHSELYWVVIENKESPFTVYTEDPSIYLQMLKPAHAKVEKASVQAPFPNGDIGFLTAIAPIGNKFHTPDIMGPQSQKNIQLNYTPVKGTLWFDFR